MKNYTITIKTIMSIIIISIFLTSCFNKRKELNVIKDQYYYTNQSQSKSQIDTSYIDSLDFNIKQLKQVYSKYFENIGAVEKYAEYGGPADAQYICYYTKEFGIIYIKNITWGNFSRLHSTNYTIENVLNKYFNYILSSQSLVCAGEDYVEYCDTILRLGNIRERRCFKKQ